MSDNASRSGSERKSASDLIALSRVFLSVMNASFVVISYDRYARNLPVDAKVFPSGNVALEEDEGEEVVVVEDMFAV